MKDKLLYSQLNSNMIIEKDQSIELAIKRLNKSASKILIALDKKKIFYGTITDGDIRRGFVKKFNLKTPVEKIINIRPIVVNKVIPEEFAKNIMQEKKIEHLPVVIKKKIKGLYFRNKIVETNKIKNKIIIMAGGKGKRLIPLTKTTPKPMISIEGKPMLLLIIKSFSNQGLKNFYISVNYLSNKIIKYFGNGSFYNLKIDYLKEKKPLGTAGSLSLLKIKKKPENIIVSNCDIIAKVDIIQMLSFHKKYKADVTIASVSHETQNPYGVIETDGFNVKNFIEKPIHKHYVNSGIYIFKSSNLRFIKKNTKEDMNNFLERLLKKKKKIIIYPIFGNWFDLGNLHVLKNFKKLKKN